MKTNERLSPEPLSSDDYSQTEVHTWFERGRTHVELRSRKTDQTIIEFWDEAVQEEVEAGYLHLGNPQRLHQDLLELAAERGFYTPVSAWLTIVINGVVITY